MSTTCSRTAVVLALLALGTAESAAPQGRRRGPSEAILSRKGSYFVEETMPAIEDAQHAEASLASCEFVQRAVSKGQLALLYLHDASEPRDKREQFEFTLFGNEELSTSLRCFCCARFDLSKNAGAFEVFGKKLPLLVAFDGKGKCAGELSMRGYRARSKQLAALLSRAARGHVKPPLSSFVKRYRAILAELRLIEGRQRALSDARKRIEGKSDRRHRVKSAEIDKAEAETKKREQALLDREARLLKKFKIPEHAAGARRLGDRPRRRGRLP